jgi:hypothetical protein
MERLSQGSIELGPFFVSRWLNTPHLVEFYSEPSFVFPEFKCNFVLHMDRLGSSGDSLFNSHGLRELSKLSPEFPEFPTNGFIVRLRRWEGHLER